MIQAQAALILSIMLESGDDIQLNMIGGAQLNGVFIGGGKSCVLINSPSGKTSIDINVIGSARHNANLMSSESLKIEIDKWVTEELSLIESKTPTTAPWLLISSSALHPALPYLAVHNPDSAKISFAIDSVLIGGIAYAALIEKSWGLLIPFGLSTVLFRYWVAKDVYSHLKSLRTEQNRLKQPDIAFCMD